MTAPYLYSRQFLAGPRVAAVPALSVGEQFCERLYVARHPALSSSAASAGATRILCLGDVVDPRSPHLDNQEIVAALAHGVREFSQFEEATSHLGGRWLMFVQIADKLRLYPDAVGTKSAFHVVTRDGEVWAASQPRLFVDALGVGVDQALWERYLSAPYADSWPAHVTPYVGTRQLLPNHYLDVATGKAHRFWPTGPLLHWTLEEAAARIADGLYRSMSALVARGTVALALTGGLDSRSLLACAGDLRPRVKLFTIVDINSYWHDVWLPRKVARLFGQPWKPIHTRRYDAAVGETFRRNVAGMWWDISDHRLYTFEKVGARFIVLGLCSEVARCFHYKDGTAPSVVTVDLLTKLSRYPGNPVAIEAFSEWLAGVPAEMNIHPLDLFFWENRMGNWASMLYTGIDTVSDTTNPYNCRELLEIGLGVDLEYRKEPYRLHRRICEIGAPESLTLPINSIWPERVWDAVAPWIPWRVRNRILTVMMRRLGFQWPRPLSPTPKQVLSDLAPDDRARLLL